MTREKTERGDPKGWARPFRSERRRSASGLLSAHCAPPSSRRASLVRGILDQAQRRGAVAAPPPLPRTGSSTSGGCPRPPEPLPLHPSSSRPVPIDTPAEKRRGGNLGGEPPLPLGGGGALKSRTLERHPSPAHCALGWRQAQEEGRHCRPSSIEKEGCSGRQFPQGAPTTEQPLTWTVARPAVCVNRHFLGTEGVDTPARTFPSPFGDLLMASAGSSRIAC
jgi:hypothetical protein